MLQSMGLQRVRHNLVTEHVNEGTLVLGQWDRRYTSKDHEEVINGKNLRGTLEEGSVPSTVETVFEEIGNEVTGHGRLKGVTTCFCNGIEKQN